jgi:hypothetical protein
MTQDEWNTARDYAYSKMGLCVVWLLLLWWVLAESWYHNIFGLCLALFFLALCTVLFCVQCVDAAEDKADLMKRSLIPKAEAK